MKSLITKLILGIITAVFFVLMLPVYILFSLFLALFENP